MASAACWLLAAVLFGLGVVVKAGEEDEFVRRLHEAMGAANADYAVNKASVKGGGYGTSLTIRYCRIDSLAPLAEIGVGSLQMINCTSPDWPATGLKNLGIRDLQVVDCLGFEDVSLIASMPRLTSLRVRGEVRDLGCLAGTNIVSLSVSSSVLDDLGFVGEMRALRNLQLEACAEILDFSPLKGSAINSLVLHRASSFSDDDTDILGTMPLRTLYLRDTEITDIEFLRSCPDIEVLHLPATVVDLRPLYGLTKLSFLEVGKLRLRGEALGAWLLAAGKEKDGPAAGNEGAVVVVDNRGPEASEGRACGWLTKR